MLFSFKKLDPAKTYVGDFPVWTFLFSPPLSWQWQDVSITFRCLWTAFFLSSPLLGSSMDMRRVLTMRFLPFPFLGATSTTTSSWVLPLFPSLFPSQTKMTDAPGFLPPITLSLPSFCLSFSKNGSHPFFSWQRKYSSFSSSLSIMEKEYFLSYFLID